ncbi:MAG: hypothetical protein LBU45_01025 [Azoarcus sp.]|nr:hypothetical protein [Azoarcus sp.]
MHLRERADFLILRVDLRAALDGALHLDSPPLVRFDLTQQRVWRLRLAKYLCQPCDLPLDLSHLFAQPWQFDVLGFFLCLFLRRCRETRNEIAGQQVLSDLHEHSGFNLFCSDALPLLPGVVKTFPIAVKRGAIRCLQDAGKQVISAAPSVRALVFERQNQYLRFIVRNQRRVRVALNHPVRSRAALDTPRIAPRRELVALVPYGVTGVGEGVPLKANGR